LPQKLAAAFCGHWCYKSGRRIHDNHICLRKEITVIKNALIEVSLIELLKIWGELIEAYHGVNGFGGHVAEIYSYRLQRYSPAGHAVGGRDDDKQEIYVRAANSLAEIVIEFSRQYDCEVLIDDRQPVKWRDLSRLTPFSHRAYVEVNRSDLRRETGASNSGSFGNKYC
jgi:hypothetical protein